MIWPWSKIRRLQQDVEHWKERAGGWHEAAKGWREDAAHAQQLATALREQVDNLTDVIVTMKRDGFQPAPRPPETEPEPALPPEVEGALGRVPAVPGLRSWAAERLEAGQDKDAVREAILSGAGHEG